MWHAQPPRVGKAGHVAPGAWMPTPLGLVVGIVFAAILLGVGVWRWRER